MSSGSEWICHVSALMHVWSIMASNGLVKDSEPTKIGC